MNEIKVYHYTFWKNNDDWNISIDTMQIHKRCHIGYIDDNQIIIPSFDNEWLGLRLDDENVSSLRTEFDYEYKTICVDYFTIDEINGYENFVKECFNALGNEILNKRSRKEK